MSLAAQLDAAERISRPRVVLVVEDEVLVRNVAAEFLREAGYSIIEAEGAGEAIAAFESGAPIDAVFTDIQMPGAMDGLMLAAWVREHHAAPVLLTSGGRDLSRIPLHFDRGAFLPKPYALPEIVRRLDALIAETTARTAPRR
jgi:CheY-like chemotaxis protein